MKEKETHNRGRIALWDVEAAAHNTSVEMTLWVPAVDF